MESPITLQSAGRRRCPQYSPGGVAAVMALSLIATIAAHGAHPLLAIPFGPALYWLVRRMGFSATDAFAIVATAGVLVALSLPAITTDCRSRRLQAGEPAVAGPDDGPSTE